MAKTAKAAKDLAEAVPEANGPMRYRATGYHEIDLPDGGVKRVEAGFIVVTDGDLIEAYPPERFAEAYPDIASEEIDDQE